jgi:TDG/mug DNA glycosylase family protein
MRSPDAPRKPDGGDGAAPSNRRPTPEELEAAAGRGVPDILAPGLGVLFCGINPGLWSGAVGHHFARPGNRFWPLLHAAGFTDRVLSPFEEVELLDGGVGVTNLVNRATRSAAELGRDELRAGARRLEDTCRATGPGIVAVLGMSAYRTAFARPRAAMGPQPEPVGGCMAWLLPNPSGLQAHYQMPALTTAFTELRRAAFDA